MKTTGRRAWRKAAKKLRCKMGRRWRSQQEWVHGKRWFELVPDLEAHRAHIAGSWFKRHGVTEQGLEKLDAPHLVRVYVGLWGTVDGDYVAYAVKPEPFTDISLVGMSQSSRKRRRWEWAQAAGQYDAPGAAKAIGAKLRIGEHLRPCPGCCACWGCEQDPTRVNPVSGNTLHWAGPVRKHTFQCPMGPPLAEKNSKQIASMLKWQEALPDDCDGSGVIPARKQG